MKLVPSCICAVALLWAPVLARAEPSGDAGDPDQGSFTLKAALRGVPGPASAPLLASIATSKGTFTCALFEQQAPAAVASFVGLARGRRAFQDPDTGRWIRRRFYDSVALIRILNNLVGVPEWHDGGFSLPHQIPGDDYGDAPATLALASAEPFGSSGARLLVAAGPPRFLDRRHTPIGRCWPLEVLEGVIWEPPSTIKSVAFSRRNLTRRDRLALQVKSYGVLGGLIKDEDIRPRDEPSQDQAKPCEPAPKVTVSDVKGWSGLTDEAARVALPRELPRVKLCYARALARDAGMQGSFTARLTIGTNGVVTTVATTSTDIDDSTLETCVRTALAELSLPSLDSGSAISLKLSLSAAP
jgi:peptidyl-prolyl cis-trans isomerase A (cyclophilin A)